MNYVFLFPGGDIGNWSLEPLISSEDLARWNEMKPSGQQTWALTELSD